MIIECTAKKIAQLLDVDQKKVRESVHMDEVPLVIGQKYVVCGLIFRAGLPWFLICEDEKAEYPIPHYAGFFRVLDARVSMHWSYLWRVGPWPEGALIPTEWCSGGFFEALLDGGVEQVMRFQSVKRALYEEANRPKK